MAVPADATEGTAVSRPFSANIGRRSPSTVFVHGEVDIATAPALRAVVGLVLDQQPDRLTLDLSDAIFMDCAGVSVIAYALRETPDGFEVIIRRPRQLVRKVLEILGMDEACIVGG
jgi:anti-sigma B factor antagonist